MLDTDLSAVRRHEVRPTGERCRAGPWLASSGGAVHCLQPSVRSSVREAGTPGRHGLRLARRTRQDDGRDRSTVARYGHQERRRDRRRPGVRGLDGRGCVRRRRPRPVHHAGRRRRRPLVPQARGGGLLQRVPGARRLPAFRSSVPIHRRRLGRHVRVPAAPAAHPPSSVGAVRSARHERWPS
jgi:hypothetical protein